MAKKSIMKKLLLAAVALVAILAVVVVVVLLNIDAITRKAIEETMAFVLQVDVSLGAVKVSLKEGSVEMRDLKIGNPEGFQTGEAFLFSSTVFFHRLHR